MRRLCEIYRSPRKAEMYLYVDKQVGLARVPDSLLARFGEPEPLMTLLLDPDRKLARVRAVEVLEKIEQEGFFLQMPPSAAELLRRESVHD